MAGRPRPRDEHGETKVALKRTQRAQAQTIGDDFSEIGLVSRHRLPDDEMDPEIAFQIVHVELMLGGNARPSRASSWALPTGLGRFPVGGRYPSRVLTRVLTQAVSWRTI
jgi:hypothetical protein